ncbi:hypothetical protein RHGRI_038728 [Rhododendron griersonianum]|uniref:Uncharacterized protein n=1 Tax=Rhododendron griersonianum TaxID=479676 RepID=A0AAV6HML7_9ERIC|nr:hypothetical protein RHGRI_038728 [Rhododendron griersonianum]
MGGGVERPGLFFVIRQMMDAIGPLELSLQAKSKHVCWMTKLSSAGDIGDESRVSVALPLESFLSLTMRNRESMKINGERSRIIMRSRTSQFVFRDPADDGCNWATRIVASSQVKPWLLDDEIFVTWRYWG